MLPDIPAYLEVPFDHFDAQDAGLLILEPRVDGVLIGPVHVDLRHDGKRDAVIQRAETLNLVFGARLLRPKPTMHLTVPLVGNGIALPYWLHGNPMTTRPRSLYLRYSASSPSYCGVNPQRDATLTIRTTLPISDANEKTFRLASSAVSPWNPSPMPIAVDWKSGARSPWCVTEFAVARGCSSDWHPSQARRVQLRLLQVTLRLGT